MTNPLTDEQAAAIRAVMGGGHVAIEALAGTGKTTTLAAIPNRNTSQLYVTFNRDPVDAARKVMPRGTKCSTIHGLAMRAVGDPWARRTRMPRLQTRDLADLLDIDDVMLTGPWGTKRITKTFQAGLALRAMRAFSISGDPAPGLWHIPIPRSARGDRDLMALYTEVQALVAPQLPIVWSKLTAIDSRLPLQSENLIKLWQLQDPVLPFDRILVDEAQDMNECYRAALEAQMTRSQLVVVGDTMQQINAWNGSVNALDRFPIDDRHWLTHCWRFGPEIAYYANLVLADLDSDHHLVGAGTDSGVTVLTHPDVVLCRSNAEAVARALKAIDDGQRPHIVGGASDVVDFAKAALQLQEHGWCAHPEIATFGSWVAVLEYVAADELGGEIRPMVDLVETVGAETIVALMGSQPDQDQADVVLSTTHKVKGRQWPDVKVADDYRVKPHDRFADPEELRLLYVAVTRASDRLDIFDVPYFT